MRFNLNRLFLGGIALCFAYCNSSAFAAEDYYLQGKKLYESGDSVSAQKYLIAEINIHPKNVSARYYLANTLLKLKDEQSAVKQYQACILLDPTGLTGQYSRSALNIIAKELARAQPKELPGNVSQTPQSNHASAVRTSALNISHQTSEIELRSVAECEARIKQVYLDADRKVQELEQERDQQIAENGEVVYRRTLLPGLRLGQAYPIYDPAEANQAIRQQYDIQIATIKQDSKKRADDISAQYKIQQAAVEDSAITIDKSYLNPNTNSTVNLIPSGTSIYTRNYQSSDAASGQAVPLLASPPKSLSRGSAPGR